MVNIDKLRGKIVENRMTVESVAAATDIASSTLYRRINTGGGAFTIEEVTKIASVLALTADEVNEIFFNRFVA